ncbi:MAG: calcium-binding protein [Rivularia sp. (in: cyanobacteria)]
MNEPNDIIYQAIDIDINGGFETGDFTAWETIGDTSIETAEFGVIPTQGDFQALLTTDFGSVSDDILENFLGLNSGDIDGIGNGDATQGSALRKTITVEAGDVLSFDFNFLTNETTFDSDPETFNDFGFVSIAPNSSSELADTGTFLISSPTEFFEETDYDNFTFEFSEAGTYTVGIGVVDSQDTIVDSGLLVDNLKVVSADKAILGTDNSESLFGEVCDDSIFGKGGNDQIFGSEGVNHLYGGAGDDTMYGGSQGDSMYGGQGNDLIFAAEGDNIVFGGLGDDTIYSGSGNDKIVGGFGDDTIWLGGGDDIVVLEVGKGIDTINNFQLGQTTFEVFADNNDLSIVDGANGAEISLSGDLLAVVSFTSANTLIDNIDTVFA